MLEWTKVVLDLAALKPESDKATYQPKNVSTFYDDKLGTKQQNIEFW